MLIIKLGGSVFAPKNSDFFDVEYLKKFYQLLGQFEEDIFFIHGAGNVGHSFVAKNGLTCESLSLWRSEVRHHLWYPFEEIFSDYQRISMEDLLRGEIDMQKLGRNSIVGGDISTDLQILSGDEAFSFAMKSIGEKIGYMVTDIDGILDERGRLLRVLNINDLDTIHFWKKEGDIQNSMFTKMTTLRKYLGSSHATVWIMDGRNLENVKSIIEKNIGIGTQIFFQ